MLVARVRYNRYRREFVDAGAQIVHDEETHVGIHMSNSVLDLLAPDEASGSTAEQL